MAEPLVTAIVSTYAAERFIRGCMEDLLSQSLGEQLEILVIDSGSPQRESAIVEEYRRAHPGRITLIRTEREPLYAAWNRAIPLARGRFLTNANTDDRHRADALERLAEALQKQPEVGLVYADQWISTRENETFSECTERGAKRRNWPDFTHHDLMLRCITGSQPMWRKELHHSLGGFNTEYRIAADYDMWLRIAAQFPLHHLPEVLGVVYESPTTISGKANRLPMNMESLKIQSQYMKLAPWNSLPGLRRALARELFGRGYQHIEADSDNQAAAPFLRKAIELDPLNVRHIKTWLIRCVLNMRPH